MIKSTLILIVLIFVFSGFSERAVAAPILDVVYESDRGIVADIGYISKFSNDLKSLGFASWVSSGSQGMKRIGVGFGGADTPFNGRAYIGLTYNWDNHSEEGMGIECSTFFAGAGWKLGWMITDNSVGTVYWGIGFGL